MPKFAGCVYYMLKTDLESCDLGLFTGACSSFNKRERGQRAGTERGPDTAGQRKNIETQYPGNVNVQCDNFLLQMLLSDPSCLNLGAKRRNNPRVTYKPCPHRLFCFHLCRSHELPSCPVGLF